MRSTLFLILITFFSTTGISQEYYQKDSSYNSVKRDSAQKNDLNKSSKSNLEVGLMAGFSRSQSFNYTYINWEKRFPVNEDFEVYASTGLAQPFGSNVISGEQKINSTSAPMLMLEGGGRYHINEKLTVYGAGFYQQELVSQNRDHESISSSAFTNDSYGFSMGMEYEVSEDVHFGIEFRHSRFQSPRSNPFFTPGTNFGSPQRGFGNGSFMRR